MNNMQGWTSRSTWIAGAALALVGAAGCSDGGVGDPCIPESIPCATDENGVMQCGYRQTEAYVESSSVQCRTRQCVVYQLEGNPREIKPPEGMSNAPNSIPFQDLEDRVYCSCRCDAPDDVRAAGDFEFCSCPDGFSCEEVLPLGGDGIRGSYCIKSSTILEDG